MIDHSTVYNIYNMCRKENVHPNTESSDLQNQDPAGGGGGGGGVTPLHGLYGYLCAIRNGVLAVLVSVWVWFLHSNLELVMTL